MAKDCGVPREALEPGSWFAVMLNFEMSHLSAFLGVAYLEVPTLFVSLVLPHFLDSASYERWVLHCVLHARNISHVLVACLSNSSL